ncbi:hypothetical protein C5L39_05240 [Corynebacterium alimapuense]|uniref:Serine protease n=1 Tax=Corynebacterium alimapuense TaxID=1576874 RepID=A0A3M8K9A9_9CORY|nr:hypothetical protein C5L39_05240 [Corynebacterium alimapuense]
MAAPTAGATEFTAPELPALEIASAEFVDHVRADLASVGITAPPVDAQLTDALDQAIVDVIPQELVSPVESATLEMPDPVATEFTEVASSESAKYETVATDPNYQWRSDPISKMMAAKPTANAVLHRVGGSWFDAPRIPVASQQAQERGVSLYGAGTPIYLGESAMCTLGAVGTDAQGRKVGLTAGHCGQPGDQVSSADSWQVGPTGTVVASNSVYDYSVIEFGSNAELTGNYNNVAVNELGGQVTSGTELCKQGVASGLTCGTTWSADEFVQFSQVCAMTGDSGGPVMAGDRIVGMISGGVLPYQQLSCQTPLQGALFMPTVSTSMDAVVSDMNAQGGVGAGFALAN